MSGKCRKASESKGDGELVIKNGENFSRNDI